VPLKTIIQTNDFVQWLSEIKTIIMSIARGLFNEQIRMEKLSKKQVSLKRSGRYYNLSDDTIE